MSSRTIDKDVLPRDRLRKSVDEKIGERKFAGCLSTQVPEAPDGLAALIADMLRPLIELERIRIPRGDNLVRHGCSRNLVESVI